MIEQEAEAIREYQERLVADALEEADNDNVILQSIRYVCFASKSKGRDRSGKRIPRRNWREVALLSYGAGSGYTQWHRFAFDVYATEIIGGFADGEILKERILEAYEKDYKQGRVIREMSILKELLEATPPKPKPGAAQKAQEDYAKAAAAVNRYLNNSSDEQFRGDIFNLVGNEILIGRLLIIGISKPQYIILANHYLQRGGG